MINYLFFVGIAAALFIAFRMLRLISYRVQRVQRFYPVVVVVELSLWIGFLFWVVTYFFESKSYYNELMLVLVIAVVVLLVWFYVKDIVAGFIFKIKHNPRTGQILYSQEGQGIIKKLSTSQLFIEGEGRNIVRIPYSRLLGKGMTLETADTHSASEAVLFLETTPGIDFTELERKLKLYLLQSPWCVPGKPIRIDFQSEPKHGIEVTVYLLDKSYAEVAKEKVKTLLDRTS